MQIETGLFDQMVLQRDPQNLSNAKISGNCNEKGILKVYVTQNHQPLENVFFHIINTENTNTFQGTLKGIPMGGPYDIKLTIETDSGKVLESVITKDVLVGDVWILAGQSNMQGAGHMKDALKPHNMTRAFYVTDEWGVAKDPLHQLYKAVDEVHTQVLGAYKDPDHIGVGPGVSFAQEMYKMQGVPQGLIACSHGGTSMTQWGPKLKSEGSLSLYGAMLRRFKKNGSNIAGVLWYQGCSDTDDVSVSLYTDKMKEFVNEVRKDFNDSTLPFVIVQISRVCGNAIASPKNWNSIQEQERVLPKSIKNLYVVPAIDLALDDGIHLSGKDQIRLGIRLAQAMAVLKFKNKSFNPPITLKNIKIIKDKYTDCSEIIITYDNVMGTLQSKDRPNGFELAENIQLLENYQIYRTDIDRNKVILKTSSQYFNSPANFLHYGYGLQPYCNITDSFDRSLPVMGPLPLPSSSAYTQFITKMLVSDFQPSSGNLSTLSYPTSQEALAFKEKTFVEKFCSLHFDILKTSPKDHVVYYKFKLQNEEDMKVKFLLGFDGSIKVWVNSELKFYDPNGINPALADEASILLDLKAGDHEILIALGTNYSKAWGIFARLQKLNVPDELLKKGLEFYCMPRITI